MNPAQLQACAPHFDASVATCIEALDRHGWVVIEEFLSASYAAELRAVAQTLYAEGAFHRAGVGRGQRWKLEPRIRGDHVHWLDPSMATGALEQWLQLAEVFRAHLNRALYLGLFDFEAHLAVYPPACAYRRHRDHFVGTENRVLTMTVYLNEAWLSTDDGLLRLFVSETEVVEVVPRMGTLVLFLSQEFEHEVATAARERWSVTGWYLRRS